MKNLNQLALQELTSAEMVNIDGGKLPYANYSWSNTDNELVYTAEAIANGGKLIYNGVAAAWNWATS